MALTPPWPTRAVIGEGPNDGPDVTDGNWHHFAAVTDPDAVNFGTAIYIDGVQTSVNAGPPALATNGKNVKIGDNPDATAAIGMAKSMTSPYGTGS